MCFGMTTGFTGAVLPQIKYLADDEAGSWLGEFFPVILKMLKKTYVRNILAIYFGNLI